MEAQSEVSAQSLLFPEPEQEIQNPEPSKPFAEFDCQVYTVAVSPQERQRIAVGLQDGTIEIWNVLTGTKWLTCQGSHDYSVLSVSFSPDGQTLASSGDDNKIKLWEIETGREIRTLIGHDSNVNSVSFSPDGQTLASGGGDNKIKLWEVETGNQIRTLSGHNGYVNSVGFSHDGQTLVSGSCDKKIKLWEVETGNQIRTLTGHDHYVNSVSFSPDGKTLASGGRDKKIKFWEVETGNQIRTFTDHDNYVNSVGFSPDGQTLASGGRDKKIKFWEVETGREILTFTGHDNSVRSVSFSPDGKTLASGGRDKKIKLWGVDTGNQIGTLSGHDGYVWSVSFSPDGQTLASGGDDKKIKLWEVETGKQIRTLTGHDNSVFSVSFSPNGQTLASGSRDRKIKLWEVETGNQIRTLSGHDNYVTSISFSPNGQTLASASFDREIKLWELETGNQIRTLSGHDGYVWSVSFSPDGQILASGGRDMKIKLWEVETGNQIRTLSGHDDYVTSVSFSSDGRTLASASSDGTVRLWDLSDTQGKRHLIIGNHEGAVYSVIFDTLKDKEGKYQKDYIISAGVDGLKAWRWQEFNITRVPQAFRNDQATGEDSLDVAKELQSLADVLMLRSLEPPLAVAILGNWGSGKSFGMHLIEKQITKIRCQQLTEKQTWGKTGDETYLSPYVGHVYQIKFNAWSYAKSDLWASLMQTIFEQLDRQLTLEQQLRTNGNVNDLAGGEIWGVLNQMSDSDRKAILESQLSEEIFANLNADNYALWDILSKVRKKEKDKLECIENELQKLEAAVQVDNQNIEQLEQDFNQEIKKIEVNIARKMSDKAILVVFLSQLKETLKDDFGNSILKDFLNSCGFKDRKDLEKQFPILKDLEKLSESTILDKAEELIKNENKKKNQKDNKIKILVKNKEQITNFLEEQPSKIVGFTEFTKKNKKILLIFLGTITLPFITYCLIVYIIPTVLNVLPFFKTISTGLQLWLTSVSAIPAISIGLEIFKKIQVLQVKAVKFFQLAKENIQEEKQKLEKEKEQKTQEEIEKAIKECQKATKEDENNEDHSKLEDEQNQDIKTIYKLKEAANKKLNENQEKIEKLQLQAERQKQRVGLTAQYTSLLDFVNNRLEENSYQKLLGIMNQVQRDLSDLSDHLTYIPGKTNPDKLAVLKEIFPRGPVRIVLYIDDLDRCPPDKVVQVLESVQLLLNTNIFIIVLAIDDRYIGRALEQTYRGVLKRGGTPSGVDYIEKIIQLPYRMRPISKDVAESYLKSLVDIQEETKQENQNFFNSQSVSQKNTVLQQTTEQSSIPLQQVNNESSFLPELEEVSEISYQDNFKEYPVIEEYTVETEETITEDNISKSQNKKSNSESKNKKIQHSANSDPLVSFERFTAEEFQWIKECCQHVDLTPRTAKRLINICKIIKIIWTPTANDTTWKIEPTPECKQTLIAFLALAGRYPKEMRKFLEEIYLEFEETDTDTVIIEKDVWLNRLQNLDVFMDRHNQREWKKFKLDFIKMPPQTEFVFEKRTFNLVTSFCFVGDIGYDPDDNYNREYRFEDRKKEYGFPKN
ncbi:P-loop NTPase fold protein [Dolichospermum sp. ST_sed6]|nr:P-loop NTPase fold protein [Dolichospermum sp. ST_sed6]